MHLQCLRNRATLVFDSDSVRLISDNPNSGCSYVKLDRMRSARLTLSEYSGDEDAAAGK